MKHTLGPLSVHQPEQWPFDIQIVDAEGNVVFQEGRYAYGTGQKTIEDVMSGYGFTKDRETVIESNERQLADAILRAAAPDLLASLQEMVEIAQRVDGWSSFPQDAIDRANAVLAKST